MKDMAHDEVFLNLYEPILENGFKYYARNCGEVHLSAFPLDLTSY